MVDNFELVKSRLSIRDVVEYYTGEHFNRDDKCHCPFPDHAEDKNPSFSILKDKNTFKCFGCDKGGSVIDFVMMYKQVDKVQAVNMLNSDFNLGLNNSKPTPKKEDIKSYLLRCEKNVGQTDYFAKRGLSPTTIKNHRLGYDASKKAVTIPYNSRMNYYQLRFTEEKRFYKPPTKEAGEEPLYNENALTKITGNPIFIVESPICAMSIEQYGERAVAICGGGGVNKLEKALKGKKTSELGFVLSLDNDDTGQRYTSEITAFLKRKGIKFVVCNIAGTEKDPNDLLMKSAEALVKNIIKAKQEYFRSCTNYGDLKSANEIVSMNIKPTNWFVEDLFTTGLSIICGASKIGKSWFVQNLCLSISNGDKFLDKPTHKQTCWYMALEDDDALTQARLNKMLKGKTAPANFLISHNIYLMDRPKQDVPTLMEYIAENIKRNPEIKMVVIDTFQKVRSSAIHGESMYAHDYRDISTLKQLADELNIAIVLIHHTNKMRDRDTDGDPFSKISGTNGLMASADCIFLLSKKRDEPSVNFTFTGRKIRYDTCTLCQNESDMTWTKLGTAEEEAHKKKLKEYQNNPYVITIKHLLASNDGDWSGSSTKFVEELGKLYPNGLPINPSPANVGKELNNLADDLKEIDSIIHLNVNPHGGTNGRSHRFYYISQKREQSSIY